MGLLTGRRQLLDINVRGSSSACLLEYIEVQCLIDHGAKRTLFWGGKKTSLLGSTVTVMASYLWGDLCLTAIFKSTFLNLYLLQKWTVLLSKAKFICKVILLLRKTRRVYTTKIETLKLGKNFFIKKEQNIIQWSVDIHEEICRKTFINPKYMISP